MDTSEEAVSVAHRPKWRVIGPGLVVAATGVGAGDLVAALVAGNRYGYALLWCAVLGAMMKIVLVEGASRYSLATGNTIFEGWRTLGKWTTWYFGPYIVIWGFVYGSAGMAGAGIPLHALFPALSVTWWGILSGLFCLVLVWWGRYALFERFVMVLVGLMFITMVSAAIMTVPNLPEMMTGLIPTVPSDGGIIYVLSLAGGVGGTITLAAYGYWLREKGWNTPTFMRVMRIDNTVAYTITGIFVVTTLIVAAELLYSANIAVTSDAAELLTLADVLTDRYGFWAGKVFLVGFAAAAMSSLVGVWNGVSLMFADFMGHTRGLDTNHADRRAGGKYYKFYLLWLTFPPMIMMFLDEPVALILAYGVLGAFFLPFLAITLLWLLNTDRVPPQWRNKLHSNVALALCALAFAVLTVHSLWKHLSGLF